MSLSDEGSAPGHARQSMERIARILGFRQGKLPWVTVTFIGLCVVVGIAERFSWRVGASLVFAPVIAEAQPYRFLGSAFLHAGFWHLLFNMYALWLVGSVLELAIGRVRFAAIYLVSAFAGNVAVLIAADPLSRSWSTATVGASGAVFGVFGALFVLMRHFGSDATSLLVVILANLALGFIPGMNISWQSHVGGLITGAVVMAAMAAHRKQSSPGVRKLRDSALLVVVVAVLIGLVVWKLHRAQSGMDAIGLSL